MASPTSFGILPDQRPPLPKHERFRVLVLGDFSGRANRRVRQPGKALATRPILPIDRDDVEAVLGRLTPRLVLPVGGQEDALELTFQELDDFDPDRLFDRLDLFAKLRQLRNRLKNPSSFATAAEEVRQWATLPPADSRSAGDGQDDDADTGVGADMLQEMFGEPTQPDPSASVEERLLAGRVDWQRMIGDVVGPLLPEGEPTQAEQKRYLDTVDQATGRQMATILHDPHFQGLESAWRGLDMLCRRIETGDDVELYLCDVSRDELAIDVLLEEELNRSGAYELLVERSVGTPGGKPWSLVVGLYDFGPGRVDAVLAGRLTQLSVAAGAAFVGSATAGHVGCPSYAEAPDPDDWNLPAYPTSLALWAELRQASFARHLSLLTPRFLLRLPYGKRTNPTQRFTLEEFDPAAPPAERGYLWGHPGILAAIGLGSQAARNGRDTDSREIFEFEDLPLHVYQDGPEEVVQPTTELLLSERGIERITDVGLTPVLAIKNRDAARISGIRSFALPVSPLALLG